MDEQLEADGALRLRLVGELDLAVRGTLARRLRELRDRRTAVRVDLSGLEFIDAAGAGELINALTDAQTDGWDVEIETETSTQVQRVLEIVAAHIRRR